MNLGEIYRMLAADRFDLLSDGEKSQLAEALERNPLLDAEGFAQRLTMALEDSDDEVRERTFLAALDAADCESAAPAKGPSEGSARPLRAAQRRRSWRVATATAACLAVAWALTLIPNRPEPSVDLDMDPSGQTLFLQAERASSVASVDLDASSAPNLTVFVEAEISASVVRWQLLDGHVDRILEGELAFPDAQAPLRSLALNIPKRLLQIESGYWIVLMDRDGELLRRWNFRTE